MLYYVRELLINKSREPYLYFSYPILFVPSGIASISVVAKGFLAKKLCRNIDIL